MSDSVIQVSQDDLATLDRITLSVTMIINSAKGLVIVVIALITALAGLFGYTTSVEIKQASNSATDAQVSATATAIAPLVSPILK